MNLSLKGNALAYPGSVAPGFDPTHIASAGVKPFNALSAVAMGGNMLNVLTGAHATLVGTTKTINGSIGPGLGFNATNDSASFVGNSVTPTNITIAAIVWLNSAPGNYEFALSLGGNNGLLTASGQWALWSNGNVISSGIPGNVINTPLFIAVSGRSASTTNFLVKNLFTGQIQTATVTSGFALGSNSTTQVIGNYSNASSDQLDGIIAAAMYAPTYMPMAALQEWAEAPWDFWYPQTAQQTMFSGLKGVSTLTYNQSASWTTTSALSEIRHTSKVYGWTTTSALSDVRSTGKIPTLTTTSAFGAVKQISATDLITTASAVGVGFGRLLFSVVSIATTSAVAAVKAVTHATTISTTSAVAAVRAVTHAATISTTSAFGAVKGVGKIATLSATSAASASRAVAAVRSIATTSALSLAKFVSHAVSIATAGAASLVAIGSKTYTSLVAIATTSSFVVVKSVAAARLLATTSALSAAKAVSKISPISASGALTAAKAVTTARSIAATSAVAADKAVAIARSLATTSALKVAKTFFVIRALATTSSLTIGKFIRRTLAIAASSTVSVLAGAGVTHTALVAIATASAALVLKTARTTVTLPPNVSAVSLVRRVGKIAAIATSSVLSQIRAVAHTVIVPHASAFVIVATKAKLQLVAIATTSAASLNFAVVRGLRLLITTVSTLSVTTFLRTIGIAGLHLVGRWASMLMSGFVAQSTLTGRWASMLMSGFVAQSTLTGRQTQMELLGMSTYVNGAFHLGETWIINGLARDETGAVLDLTGATVQLRLVSENPNAIALDLTTPTNGSITAPTLGTYLFLITPAQQTALTLTSYEFEARVTLANGTISVQNTGEIEVLPSKFVNFP